MAETPRTITAKGYLVLEAVRMVSYPDRVSSAKIGKATKTRPRTHYPDQAVLELEVTVPVALFEHPPILVEVTMPELPHEASVSIGEARDG